MTRASANVCVCLLLVASVGAAQTPIPLEPPSDYPPLDRLAWPEVRRHLVVVAATSRLRAAPDEAATLDLLLQVRRLDDALDVLQRIVDTRPDRVPPALRLIALSTHEFLLDRAHPRLERLRGLLAAVRGRTATLPREDAARVTLSLISLELSLSELRDQDDWITRVRGFIETYAGTATALLSEVDVLTHGRPDAARLDALQAFADRHRGTEAGAKALYAKGFHLHVNVRDPAGSDPTERFLQVAAIVRELESGRYPDCEWTRKAPDLVIGFFATMRAVFARETVDQVLDAHREFVLSHFPMGEIEPDTRLGYLVTGRMVDLYAVKGDALAGIEGFLSDLERRAADPSAVRYLRALLYLQWMDPQRFRLMSEGPPPIAEPRDALLRKAQSVLRALQQDGSDHYRRKALATQASVDFYERNFADARVSYRRYVELYPRSPWAWIAGLRAAQSDEALEDWDAAARGYAAVATTHATDPFASTLGHAYAARALESSGRLDEALRAHRQALAAWHVDTVVYLPTQHRPNEEMTIAISEDPTRLVRDAVNERVATLTRLLAVPGGPQVERGRWLLAKRRPREARVVLERAAVEFPASPAALEAQVLARRARLDAALAWANVENDDADEAKAIGELEALAREPYDVTVCVAKIAHASMLWTRGRADDARASMGRALDEWLAQRAPETSALSDVEQDALAIRDVVFKPALDGIYSSAGWNAAEAPAEPARFIVMNPRLEIKLPGGHLASVTSSRPPPGMTNVLFMTDEQIALLDTVMRALGGTKRREPRAIMEVPNQPIGTALDILAFWRTFFAARPGHWGGWVFETYPIVHRVEFLNAERTKAGAAVTVGYSGATIVVEKVNGVWKATAVTNLWVT